MTTARLLLDPTAERSPVKRQAPPRPSTLEGLTIALLDITKTTSTVFLDEIETELTGRGLAIRRYRKQTFARLAPIELRQAIGLECDLVIEALAD